MQFCITNTKVASMKITIIRHSIRDSVGDKVINEYAGYLLGKGHEVIYWTNEIMPGLCLDNRIKLKKIPFKGKIGTILFTVLTNFHSDVLLVDIVVMGCCAWIRNAKSVLYFAQDYDVRYYSSKLMQGLLKVIYWTAFNVMNIPAIAVSRDLAKLLEKHTQRKIEVVLNGIDHRIFYREDRSRFLPEKRASQAIILYARSDFRKGLDIGIKAIEELARLRGVNDWELWAIGDDPLSVSIEGVKVKRWGFMAEDDLRAIFSAADIYLLPSRSEGLSLLLLSALACQCVVVGTAASNIITDEVDGLVSPIEDWKALAKNLNRVMSDKSLFMKLSRNGQLLAKKYDSEKSCAQFETALTEFVNKKRKPAP